MTDDSTRKKLVYCLKCGHNFVSKSKEPRCSKCQSFRVIDHKEISAKKDVFDLKARVKEIENDITEINEKLEYIRKVLHKGGLV